jgi:hypothetical protein
VSLVSVLLRLQVTRVRLQDLAQSLPGTVVAALLPGFALATLLSPRWHWWARLGMAPGLSCGFIGIVGLAMHDAHIPFEPLTMLPLLALLGVGAIFRWRRCEPGVTTLAPWWLPVPALIAGAIGAGVFAWALHGQVLPPDWDAPVHAGLASTIARSHDVLPLIRIPLEGTSFVRRRPGFEATAVLVSWLGAPSPPTAMAPVVAVTLLLMPLSLSLLALETTGSIALAAVVPFFALGLAFPADQAILGRFPEMVDSTLVVPFIVVVVRVMRGVLTRDNTLLLVAITASIWVIHGLEIVTAAIVACGLFAAVAVRALHKSPRDALIRVGVAVGAVLIGAALVTLLTRTPQVPPPTTTEPSSVVLPTTSSPVMLHQLLAGVAQTDLVSPVALALYVIGVVVLLIQRRMLWVLLAQGVLVVLMVDDFYLHRFERLWRAVYPLGDADRILGVQYWLIPLVLGAGFLAVLRVMRSLSRTRRLQIGTSVAALVIALIAVVARHQLGQLWTQLFGAYPFYIYPLGTFDPLAEYRRWIPTIATAALAVIIAWVALARGVPLPVLIRERLGPTDHGLDAAGLALAIVAVLCLVVGASADYGVYQSEIAKRSLATPADLAVLKAMDAIFPPGLIVMTDGLADAGMWMTAFTHLTPLVPNSFEAGTLSVALDAALANACHDPVAAEAGLRRADVIFVGSHRVTGPNNRLWNVDCIARLANVRLVTSAPWQGTMAAAFVVIK